MFHFFECAAKHCKCKARGVRRFQDSQDRAATSNLKAHAIKCFGADAVDAAFNKTTSAAQDGSIFASFARLGQASQSISNRAYTTDEIRLVWGFTHNMLYFIITLYIYTGPTLLGGVLKVTGQ